VADRPEISQRERRLPSKAPIEVAERQTRDLGELSTIGRDASPVPPRIDLATASSPMITRPSQ
jgi:hypothetical protein